MLARQVPECERQRGWVEDSPVSLPALAGVAACSQAPCRPNAAAKTNTAAPEERDGESMA
jgi:hypothetical protein